MKTLAGSALGLLFLAALTACADVPGGGGDDAGPRGGPPAGRNPHYPNVFISPFGQPFHARFGQPYPVATWFAAADADHDGKLTRDEFSADAKAFFATLDTNHDGVIDGTEIESYEQNVAPEILPQIGRLRDGEGADAALDLDDPHNTERPVRAPRRSAQARPQRPANTEPTQGAGLFSLLNQPEPVSAADTDFNGSVSAAEFMAAADRRFARLDAKQQGYLTLAGLPKTPVQEAIEQAAKRQARQRHGRPAQREGGEREGGEPPSGDPPQ